MNPKRSETPRVCAVPRFTLLMGATEVIAVVTSKPLRPGKLQLQRF